MQSTLKLQCSLTAFLSIDFSFWCTLYAKKSSLPIRRKENADKLIRRETLLNKKITFSTFPSRSISVRVVQDTNIHDTRKSTLGIRRIISADSLARNKNNKKVPHCDKHLNYANFSSLSLLCNRISVRVLPKRHVTYIPGIITSTYLFHPMARATGCLIFHGLSARGLVYCRNKTLRCSARERELFGTLWPTPPGRPGSEQNIFH